MEKRVIGPVTVIHGDMRAALKDYRNAVDLVVTDPPYKLTSGGRNSDAMKGKFSKDRYDNSGNLMKILPWSEMAPEIFASLKTDSDCYVMSNDKNLFEAHAAFVNAGFRFHNLLAWDKNSPTRNRWYMKHMEFTLYLFKGKARTIRNPGSKQLFPSKRPDLDWHSTSKPVELMRHYIENSSDPGDLVLDPFSGSAATGVAAMECGRRALLIEIDAGYFTKACARLQDRWDQLSAVVPREDRKAI